MWNTIISSGKKKGYIIKLMNKYLNRNYYETDDAFYRKKANIDCWEQMQYQSLRDYNIDYWLVFCNSINIEIQQAKDQLFIKPHNLAYNKNLFEYHLVTTNPRLAGESINSILSMKKFVIFQTAFDFLKTYSWYRTTEPYTRFSHNAMIIGEDEQYYFYVDSPPMRNIKYFIPYHENASVGCIDKQELQHSFQYHCRIGYIEINENFLNHISDILMILKGIKSTYFDNQENDIKIGRSALLAFKNTLKNKIALEFLLTDSFVFDLIASRHSILKICIEKYCALIKNLNYNEYIHILDALIFKWRIIEKLSIKYTLTRDFYISEKIANLIEYDVIPLTDRFIQII